MIFIFYKMQIKYVMFISCFLGILYAEGKKDILVNVKGSEITITVPSSDCKVKNCFFSTEIEKGCISDYVFVHSRDKNGTLDFVINVKRPLLADDLLRIFGVFETDNEVITEVYDLFIDSHGNGKNINDPIFKEDFDQTFSQWTHEIRSRMNDPENDSEFVAFLNNTNTNYIKDGYLNIVATWANYTNNLPFAVDGCTSRKVNPSRKKDCGPQIPLQYKLPPVHSAKLHTFGKFQFKYGRVEIRARMPIGDWLYPYLILQPIKYRSEENFVNQLRIAFTRSNALLQNNESIPISRDRLFGSAVLWKSGKFSEYVHFKKYSTYNPLSNDFHNYTLIWHKDHITYKVDNNTYGTITNSTVLNAFNSECYIVLGLSAAGNVNFPDETIMFKHKRFLNNDPMGPYQFEKFTDKKTWTQPNLLIDSVYVYKTHGTDE